MSRMRLLFAIAAALGLPCLRIGDAQTQTPGVPASAFRLGLIVGHRFAIQGAPFTAEVETTWTGGDSTAAGSDITRAIRDSEGRQRFETEPGGRPLITLWDVPRERIIRLNPLTKTAIVSPMTPIGKPVLVPASRLAGAPAATRPHPADPIGARTVAGLETEGGHVTITWKNEDGTLTQSPRDYWLSTAYRMTVMSEYENPKYGNVVERVTRFDPTEPDSALFTIPADYKILEAPTGSTVAPKQPLPATRAVPVPAPGLTLRQTPTPIVIKNAGPCTPSVGTSVLAQIAESSAWVSQTKNAPFSATGEVTIDQKLPGGNTIHGIATTHLARDGAGRTRLEKVKRCWLGEDGEFKAAWTITVTDPSPRTTMTWDIDDLSPKVVKLTHLPERKTGPGTPQTPEQALIQKISALNQPPQSETVNENLGTRTFENIPTEGFRTTHKIPVGEIGNDRPLLSVHESWGSRDYGQTMMLIEDNPTEGRAEFELKVVKPWEPDPGLFSPPEGYKIEETFPKQ